MAITNQAQQSILKVGEIVKIYLSRFPGATDYVGMRGEVVKIKANKKEVVHVVKFNDGNEWFYSRDQLRRA